MQSSRKQRGKANFIHRSRRHLCAAHKTWMPAQMGAIGATTSHHKPESSLQQVQKKKIRKRKEKKHKNTHERGEKQKIRKRKNQTEKPDTTTSNIGIKINNCFWPASSSSWQRTQSARGVGWWEGGGLGSGIPHDLLAPSIRSLIALSPTTLGRVVN